ERHRGLLAGADRRARVGSPAPGGVGFAAMAAPEYVPVDRTHQARTYTSPPRLPDQWRAQRPADLTGPQPRGPRLGAPGPDQGYVMTLARQLEGTLTL